MTHQMGKVALTGIAPTDASWLKRAQPLLPSQGLSDCSESVSSVPVQVPTVLCDSLGKYEPTLFTPDRLATLNQRDNSI